MGSRGGGGGLKAGRRMKESGRKYSKDFSPFPGRGRDSFSNDNNAASKSFNGVECPWWLDGWIVAKRIKGRCHRCFNQMMIKIIIIKVELRSYFRTGPGMQRVGHLKPIKNYKGNVNHKPPPPPAEAVKVTVSLSIAILFHDAQCDPGQGNSKD